MNLIEWRSVWEDGVRDDFCANRLVTEMDLQAALYLHLRALPSVAFVHCQPRVRVQRLTFVPDLVVRGQGDEVCFVELKFQHRTGAGPRWRDDLQKFVQLNEAFHREGQLLLEGRGRSEPIVLRGAPTFLLAAVATSECEAVDLNCVQRAAEEHAKGLALYWAAGALDPTGDTAKDAFEGPVKV